MRGFEIDLIVKDSLKSLERYQRIFDLEIVEVTNLSVGQNEAVFISKQG